MNIDETTLKSFFWFLRLSAGPQKLEHNVDHNYLLFKFEKSLKKVRGVFLIMKIRVIIVLKKKPQGTKKIKKCCFINIHEILK